MKKPAKNSTMKKIGWRAFAVFAVAFLVVLIVTAPATLLAKIVDGSSSGQFVLANASGTVWQGSATPVIRQRTGNLLALEKLHWDISLLPLFSGKLIAQVRWDNVEQIQPMLATISFSQIELRNAVIPLQAGILGELAPMLQPVQLSGQMLIKSEQFALSRSGIIGNAVADWLGAGSVLSSVNPLGSYRINLTGAGERLDISLMTLSGALLLEGTGNFTRDQGLRFQATARAAADSKGSLDELLSNFGPESAPGVHSINLMP
ncbi:MAG TPA: type II secretion system protein N [Gallionellaceae bacterium]|nr:type II secretion system protein N [Gallionellaceae bacterium]